MLTKHITCYNKLTAIYVNCFTLKYRKCKKEFESLGFFRDTTQNRCKNVKSSIEMYKHLQCHIHIFQSAAKNH